MEEIWKDIDGFENAYQVSNYGRIKSIGRYVNHISGKRFVKERILKPRVGTSGYYQYPLNLSGRAKTILIHREVAKAFLPNPNNLPQVNHKDENKLNNYFENLEWCDGMYNENYGTKKKREIETQQKTHPHNKAVVQMTKDGKVMASFISIRWASRELGIPHPNISECVNGKRKTAGGYVWRFKDDVSD